MEDDMGMNGGRNNFASEESNFGGPPPGNRYIGLSGKNVPNYADEPSDVYNNRGGRSNNLSSNYRPSSNEEIVEARQSLMLLKSKMKSNVPQR